MPAPRSSTRPRGPLSRRSADRPPARPRRSHDAKCLARRTGGLPAGNCRPAGAAAGPFSVTGAGGPADGRPESVARAHSHHVNGRCALEPDGTSAARILPLARPRGTPLPRRRRPLSKRRLPECSARPGRYPHSAAEASRSPSGGPKAAIRRSSNPFGLSGPPWRREWQPWQPACGTLPPQAQPRMDFLGLPVGSQTCAATHTLARPDSLPANHCTACSSTMEVHYEA